MNRPRITDFPAKYREQVSREVSRQLGAGNGPTVAAAPRVIATYYQTSNQEDWIRQVQVTRETPLHIGVLTDTGAVRETLRVAPGERYWPTREEAVAAVRTRLFADIHAAEDAFKAFIEREAQRKES